MDLPTLVLLALAVTILFVLYLRAPQTAAAGLRITAGSLIDIAPRRLAALLLAVRIASSFFFPVLAGWLSGLLFERLRPS